ncbi:helix-turn-helix domain-containing protein [Streptomyces sp. NPDC056347]|uniref:helix-turn-helix domain-containing protein n=1 Tax=Streptomyces sp. NPDC056347 TaxID=3345790 RepID=UPI0035E34E90
MDAQQNTAPPCAPSAVRGDAAPSTPPPAPSSGVIHVNFRHASGFTVVGNHLTQHRGLSLTAIGLAAHIQSLPAGARIGIKRLAERFPESETRIAAALRELEAHGYLHRSRLRLADGRVVTRTVSYNQPGATARPAPVARPRPSKPVPPAPLPPAPPSPQRQRHRPQPEVTRTPAPAPALPIPAPVPGPARIPAPAPAPAPVPVPAPTARTRPLPPLPLPQHLTPELLRTAAALLADLRRHESLLVLSEHDIETLAPGVAAWLERDARPDTIRHKLTTDLPAPLKHPAKLLRHRITALLPPPLPGADAITYVRPGPAVTPFQNCDGCDRAFRSHHPGRCRDCRAELHSAA